MSIVDKFTYRLAEMITGRNDVKYMIDRLFETGKFIEEKDGEFYLNLQLIKNMRERISREYTKEQVNNLYYNAGLYYEMENQVIKALEMYKICENYSRISGILIRNTDVSLNTGYLFELRYYYMKLPEETVEKSVSLMSGMSMLYSILMQPEKSEYWYRKLKNYEKRQRTGSASKKEAKSRMAYLDVALPHRGSKKIKEMLVSMAVIYRYAGE